MPSEHAHQCTLIGWFDKTYPSFEGRLFAVPNGGLRNKVVAQKLKMEGLRPGVPDLFLPVSRLGYHGLFIEMKAETGSATAKQKDWVSFLSDMGYKAVICKGWLEAKEVIEGYLGETSL